jgi:hypothetical protein
MMSFHTATDQPELRPLGVCTQCGVREAAEVAIFWSQDTYGGLTCPECSGEMPEVGYPHWVCYARDDTPGAMSKMMGPYSHGEAERVRDRFAALENVESAWIITPPEAK